MNVSTYKSFLIAGKRTMVVASMGKCGYAGFKEYQIRCSNGFWIVDRTDGYNATYIGSYPSSKSLKSVINLVWGK